MNVVVVILDSLRKDHVGAYGNDRIKTPNLDALAKDSDKLWRFSEKALQVDPERFGIEPAVHLAWLKRQIDRWFFTETAKEIARKEHDLRAASLGVPSEERERDE